MTKKVNEILAALPKLSQPELATIKAAVEHLLTKLDSTDDTLPLFTIVRLRLGVKVSFGQFKATSAYPVWRKKAAVVVSFIDQWWPDAKKTERGALLTLAVDLLLSDLKRCQIPATLSSISSSLDRIPQLIDFELPDYRQSGLSHLVLKAMSTRRRE